MASGEEGQQELLVQAADLLSSDERKALGDDKSIRAAVDPGLSIYESENVDVTIVRDYFIDYQPLAPLSQGRMIDYVIPATSTHWFDFRRSYLAMKAKICRSDGSNLKDSDKVGVCNALAYTAFKECSISLQQKNVSNEVGQFYNYKFILDSYVYMTEDLVKNSLQAGLCFPDTPGHHDSTSVAATGVNKGLLDRYEFTSKGEFCMQGFLNHDITQMKGYLPPGIEIVIRLTKADDDVLLMSAVETERYKLVFTECTLKMQAVELSPGALTKQHELLSKHNAYYHFTKSIFKSYTLEKGITSWSMAQLFGNFLPTEFCFVLVPVSHYSGSLSKNPFLFTDLKMKEVCFRAEGYQPRIIQTDFTNLHLSELYRCLYDPDEGQRPGAGLIKMRHLAQGYCVWHIKLGKSSYERMLRIRYGQSHLSLNFAEPTSEAHVLICYAKKHDYFSVDVFRNVFTSDSCL